MEEMEPRTEGKVWRDELVSPLMLIFGESADCLLQLLRRICESGHPQRREGVVHQTNFVE